jgi:hypothetical protein
MIVEVHGSGKVPDALAQRKQTPKSSKVERVSGVKSLQSLNTRESDFSVYMYTMKQAYTVNPVHTVPGKIIVDTLDVPVVEGV